MWRNVSRRRPRPTRANKPVNFKFPQPTVATPLPTSASAFLPFPALVLGICKIIFLRELLNILNSSSIQDLQLPWQYLWQKKREREREGARKKRKSIQGWQGNNWFHYIQPADSLYHRWQGDGRQAEGACICVWVVINYCRGQGCTGRTRWLNETKLISLWHLPASYSGIWRCREDKSP